MSTIPSQPHLVFQPRRQGPAIAAVVVLHLTLWWAVTRPGQQKVEPDARVWLQLLQARQRASVPERPPPPIQASPAPTRSSNSRDKAAARLMPTPIPSPAAAHDSLPAEAKPVAPEPDAIPLAQRAREAAGAIDRQLRTEHPQEFVAPPDTPQTRLAKGFAEARAAVRPKWNEAARIELWSAPNDPRRIYSVTTATGEYCIYMPDKGSMSLNLSARSGHAGFGGGTAAPCPIRF